MSTNIEREMAYMVGLMLHAFFKRIFSVGVEVRVSLVCWTSPQTAVNISINPLQQLYRTELHCQPVEGTYFVCFTLQ